MANGLAALFIATGQDVANVAESHAGMVYSQVTDDGETEEVEESVVDAAEGLDVEAPEEETVEDLAEGLPGLLREVSAAGSRLSGLRVDPPTLQSVFLHLTGREHLRCFIGRNINQFHIRLGHTVLLKRLEQQQVTDKTDFHTENEDPPKLAISGPN